MYLVYEGARGDEKKRKVVAVLKVSVGAILAAEYQTGGSVIRSARTAHSEKKRNLERNSQACVTISQPGVMDHVVAWGTIELRHTEIQRKK